jgi:hypothetical protein
MALSKDTQNTYEIGDTGEFPVVSAGTIYMGGAVGIPSGVGTARALIATDKFVGFAIDGVVNAAGGSKAVRVKATGMIAATITGLTAATPPGTSVYMSDDNTYTTTATSNSLVGKVHRVITGGTKAVVRFDADLV